jgi:hypothetical protein
MVLLENAEGLFVVGPVNHATPETLFERRWALTVDAFARNGRLRNALRSSTSSRRACWDRRWLADTSPWRPASTSETLPARSDPGGPDV